MASKARKACEKTASEVLKNNYYLRDTPLLLPEDDLEAKASTLAVSLRGDFCWTPCFAPEFVAGLMRHGFLPIATPINGPSKIVLLPKLHARRSCISLDQFHVRRKTKHEGRALRFSVDQAFDAVAAGCVEEHGQNWLYPPVVDCLRAMHLAKGAMGVRMHSVEVWEGDRVVAGELGYACGGTYTSMTGFHTTRGSGMVQLNCLGKLLRDRGFVLWDLGMHLPYKGTLGAANVPRIVFLGRLRAASVVVAELQCPLMSCGELFPSRAEQQTPPNPASKRQRKRAAKRARKDAFKAARREQQAQTKPQKSDAPAADDAPAAEAL